jgi:WD40 repeat protein/uncharacterized caspase-like protein
MTPEIVVQSGHTLGIADLAMSPDDQFIASASADETVRLWDLRVGCEFRVLTGHQGPVYAVRWSPDGQCLASGGFDKCTLVWRPGTGELLHRLDPAAQPVSQLAFDRSGQRLMAASQLLYGSGEVLVWRLDDGTLLRRLALTADPGQQRLCVALSPDGATLALAWPKPRRVELVDLASGRSVLTVPLRASAVGAGADDDPGSLAFVDDGRALLHCGGVDPPDWIAIELPAGTAATPRSWSSGLPRLTRLTLRSDGRLLLQGPDGYELWDAAARQRLGQGSRPVDEVSSDGRLTVQASGRVLHLNDAATGTALYALGDRPLTPTALGNLARHYAVASNPVYPMLAASAPDGCIRLWDLRSGRGPAIFKAGDGGIEDLAFSPDGKLLAAASSPLRVWDAWTQRLLAEVATDERPTRLAFSTDGAALVAVGHKAMTLVNLRDQRFQDQPLPLKQSASGIVFEPGSHRFYVAGVHGEWLRCQLDGSAPQVHQHPAPIGALANSAGGLAIVYSQRRWVEGLLQNMAGQAGPAAMSVVSFLADGAAQPVSLTGGSPYALGAAVSPDGHWVATACGGGELNLWDLAQPPAGQAPRVWLAHPGGATAVAWASDGRFLVSTGMDGAVRLWQPHDQALAATLVSLTDSDHVIVVADGSYTATRGGLAGVVFRIDGRAVPFDQFDLALNRPDRLLDRLGYAYHDLIDALALAHGRRVQRMGVQPPEPGAAMQLPQLHRLSPLPPLADDAAELAVRVQAQPTRAALARLLVFVNDVPHPHRLGLDLAGATGVVDQTLRIPLGYGANRIELSVLDAQGGESLRQVIQTTRTGAAAPGRLFILALGVSRYREARLNLQLAAKDAQDLARTLARCQRHFSAVRSHVLTDQAATRDAILASRGFLQDAGVDDQVVLFFAGHGALFDGDYRFLPHDFDSADPLASGLAYAQIEALLDGLAARRRLVLLDTCHAGEADLVVPQGEGGPPAAAAGVRAYRRLGPQRRPQAAATVGVADRALEDLFADLRRGAGAYVIAAAGAAEYAVESQQLGNGVFTHCVLQALQDQALLTRQGGKLRVSELHRLVGQRVVALTGGRQQPMSRRENLRNDFSVI